MATGCQKPMMDMPCLTNRRAETSRKRAWSTSMFPGPSARTVYVLNSKHRDVGAMFLPVTADPHGGVGLPPRPPRAGCAWAAGVAGAAGDGGVCASPVTVSDNPSPQRHSD